MSAIAPQKAKEIRKERADQAKVGLPASSAPVLLHSCTPPPPPSIQCWQAPDEDLLHFVEGEKRLT